MDVDSLVVGVLPPPLPPPALPSLLVLSSFQSPVPPLDRVFDTFSLVATSVEVLKIF